MVLPSLSKFYDGRTNTLFKQLNYSAFLFLCEFPLQRQALAVVFFTYRDRGKTDQYFASRVTLNYLRPNVSDGRLENFRLGLLHLFEIGSVFSQSTSFSCFDGGSEKVVEERLFDAGIRVIRPIDCYPQTPTQRFGVVLLNKHVVLSVVVLWAVQYLFSNSSRNVIVRLSLFAQSKNAFLLRTLVRYIIEYFFFVLFFCFQIRFRSDLILRKFYTYWIRWIVRLIASCCNSLDFRFFFVLPVVAIHIKEEQNASR